MNQCIIDRYNKGQYEYKATIKRLERHIFENDIIYVDSKRTNIYEFLFAPKYGFAKAFVKHLKSGVYKGKPITLTENGLKIKMATEPDVLKYLEKFSDSF